MKVALESLNTVGDVYVTKSSAGFTTQWTVEFWSNIGDLSELMMHKSNLVGDGISLEVSTLVHGTMPHFEEGTVGVHVLPLGSKIITANKAAQKITVESQAADLDGTFTIFFKGEKSHQYG